MDDSLIAEVCDVLSAGGVAIIPTETVYGLACVYDNKDALARIFEIKRRPEDKHIALLVPDFESAGFIAEITRDALKLQKAFTPGPLTVILNGKGAKAGQTVGLRVPDKAETLAILKELGKPIACTSANVSGASSPVNLSEALSQVGDGADIAVDGGACDLGIASTVLDMTAVPYRIARSGGVSKRSIERVLDTAVSGAVIIGLSGTTGSGKSTALTALKELGAEIIDCDKIYRELTYGNTAMLEEINAAFPNSVKDGVLDRKILASIVFADDEKLKLLNTVTHKYVRAEVLKRINESSNAVVAIEAIALFDSKLSQLCDYKVAVTADAGKRIERIMKRDNLTIEQAKARIDAQKPDEYFKSQADITLYGNFGSELEFKEYCKNELKQMLGDI